MTIKYLTLTLTRTLTDQAAQIADQENLLHLERNAAEADIRHKFERRLEQKQHDDRMMREETLAELESRGKGLREQLDSMRQTVTEKQFMMDELQAKAKTESMEMRKRESQLIADYEGRLSQAAKERSDLLTDRNKEGVSKRKAQDIEHSQTLARLDDQAYNDLEASPF